MIRAKKHFGQHFLKSESALKKIVAAGNISKNDTVLEIGPGTGVLTEKLLNVAGKVIAIEKDRDLIPVLRDKFSNNISNGTLEIIEQDILDFDPESIPTPYKLIANIPYYITGLILEKFLSSIHKPMCAVLLVQKEVAERIVARDGKQSILSISVAVYGDPKTIAAVPAGAFNPTPKVDSAILLIDNISNSFFSNLDEALFFSLIKFVFSKKRKQFGGTLAEYIENKVKALAVLETVRLDPKTRPENLTKEEWKSILQALGNQ